MKVIEPGHIYELDQFDTDSLDGPIRLTFVNREKGNEHPGTLTQEVLRAQIDMISTLIDRTNHCDACLRWEGNDKIVKALSESQRQLRLALLYHEQRALERKTEKGQLEPEKVPTGTDGHFKIGGYSKVYICLNCADAAKKGTTYRRWPCLEEGKCGKPMSTNE